MRWNIEEGFAQVYQECSRFDTQEGNWQDIASLKIARYHAFGVGVNKKVFIAGRVGELLGVALKTCEVYNIETDEWHFFATLTVPRAIGYMVLAEQTLFVMPGYNFNTEKDLQMSVMTVEKMSGTLRQTHCFKLGGATQRPVHLGF